MAKTNKYASINFNDIYDKKTSSSAATVATTAGKHHPFSSPTTTHKSYSLSAASRSHGMLVLSRPSPKPVSHPQPPSPSLPPVSPKLQSPPPLTDQPRAESDSVSLRPQGKTGPGPSVAAPSPSQFPGLGSGEKELMVATATTKSHKFVPPHLRPGFVAQEERPAVMTCGQGREAGGYRPGGAGGGGFGSASSPSRYGEDRRPKSGGGYGRRGFLDSGDMNRSRSGGNRPSSSG